MFEMYIFVSYTHTMTTLVDGERGHDGAAPGQQRKTKLVTAEKTT